jgi:hypothetical protein
VGIAGAAVVTAAWMWLICAFGTGPDIAPLSGAAMVAMPRAPAIPT